MWPISAASARFASRRGRAVVLERHLDQHRRRHPRRLAQQRHRLRHVLEHVRHHREVVGAVLGGHVRRRRRPRRAARRRARGRSPPPAARARSRRARAATPRAPSSASSAPSPQPISTSVPGRIPARAQQRHDVVGLGARAQRPPAAHPLRLRGVRQRVALGVEVLEVAHGWATREVRPSPGASARRPRRAAMRVTKWPRRERTVTVLTVPKRVAPAPELDRARAGGSRSPPAAPARRAAAPRPRSAAGRRRRRACAPVDVAQPALEARDRRLVDELVLRHRPHARVAPRHPVGLVEVRGLPAHAARRRCGPAGWSGSRTRCSRRAAAAGAAPPGPRRRGSA